MAKASDDSGVTSVVTIQRPARLSDIAAEHLRERILRGTYPPGSPLSQETLAQEFSISRTPLRDALKALERDGLVELDDSGAASVVSISPEDARDLLRIRETIDGVAARRAASLPADRREALGAVLQPILDELDIAAKEEDRYRFRVADSRFHVAILKHCDSKQLTNCQAFVHGTALSSYASRVPSPGHLARSAEDHRRIADAVLSGDVDRSVQAARDHVSKAYRYYYGDRSTTGAA
jgi:DNA-binding GntR family transcriptional regulator